MPRYVRLARSPKAYRDEWEGYENPVTPVQVCDHEYIDTGLIFPDGEPVLRAPNPIGFGRDEEW